MYSVIVEINKMTVLTGIMKIFILLLALVAFSANASHHRGHALGYLEQIQERVEIIQAYSVNLASRLTPGTHPWQLTFTPPNIVGGVFPGNIYGIEVRTKVAIDALNGIFPPICYQYGLQPGEELKCARRLINQPHAASPGPRSVLQYSTTAMYGVAVFVTWEEGCDPTGQWCSDADLAVVVFVLNDLWADAQWALWHINAAIKEET